MWMKMKTSLHIEGFYQFQLTDNIAITPGAIWITAPTSTMTTMILSSVRSELLSLSSLEFFTKQKNDQLTTAGQKNFFALSSQFETLTARSQSYSRYKSIGSYA